jgi:hypothetical protein
MNRRGFLKLFSAGVAGIALDQAIPLGRVWSFPKEIVIAKTAMFTIRNGLGYPLGINRISSAISLNEPFGIDFPWDDYEKALKIGNLLQQFSFTRYFPNAPAAPPPHRRPQTAKGSERSN